MKSKKIIGILIALAMFIVVLAGCAPAVREQPAEDPQEDPQEDPVVEERVEMEWGADVNNGRPFNLEPTKWDTRADRYLFGINATILPIVEEPVTLEMWRGFTSTIMTSMSEGKTFIEMERRTNVALEFAYPPVGSEPDNFNLRIASGDLPHIFVHPPGYPGGFVQAVEDGIYLDLTPYYERGLMPNFQWVRENHPDIYRDTMTDDGRLLFWPMLDMVPSHPWSGLWVREDWVNELGLELPETIEDWDTMLRAMKAEYDIYPLAMNILLWYGVSTNYMFASSFGTGYNWLNKDGEVIYGPVDPGFKDWLTLMHGWFADGLIDPDFATRDFSSYTAHLANSGAGGFGLAYGEYGQVSLTGRSLDPDFVITPVVMPTSYEGQEIRLRQDNSTVRMDRTFFTTRLVDDGLDDVAVKWQDYWYSQDGGDLASYGPEGVSFRWMPDGSFDWIYPRLGEEGLDFWTVLPLFKMHTGPYLRNSMAYEFLPGVHKSIATWGSQKADWRMPEHISLTPDESKELSDIMVDVNTFRDERTLQFIMGMEPLENFDDFVAEIEGMGIGRATEIMTAALERYLER